MYLEDMIYGGDYGRTDELTEGCAGTEYGTAAFGNCTEHV